ncbi:hypothetical protein COCMIDRAFT_97400, partial [Bipolaris oryzae ATCC 44560]
LPHLSLVPQYIPTKFLFHTHSTHTYAYPRTNTHLHILQPWVSCGTRALAERGLAAVLLLTNTVFDAHPFASRAVVSLASAKHPPALHQRFTTCKSNRLARGDH